MCKVFGGQCTSLDFSGRAGTLNTNVKKQTHQQHLSTRRHVMTWSPCAHVSSSSQIPKITSAVVASERLPLFLSNWSPQPPCITESLHYHPICFCPICVSFLPGDRPQPRGRLPEDEAERPEQGDADSAGEPLLARAGPNPSALCGP